MLYFEDPIYFLLLIPVLAAGWRLYRRPSAGSIVFASFSGMPRHRITWRIAVARLATFLFPAALVLLVVAIARPQLRFERDVRRAHALGVQMVLDTSGSMAKPGLQTGGQEDGTEEEPSRLDIVKGCFAGFVKQRPDDLIGLVTFGGYAVTKAPLTLDHQALLHLLAGVDIPGRAPGAERVVDKEELLTAIGDALAVACARLDKAEVKSKLIILLTDGGSNAGIVNPEVAMQVAARLGIRVYTIGVGAGANTAHPDGQEQEGADVALLKKIADTTGGLYFDAGSPAELSGVLASINKLEKTEVETFPFIRRRELFPLFLIPALCLVLGSITASVLIRRRIV